MGLKGPMRTGGLWAKEGPGPPLAREMVVFAFVPSELFRKAHLLRAYLSVSCGGTTGSKQMIQVQVLTLLLLHTDAYWQIHAGSLISSPACFGKRLGVRWVKPTELWVVVLGWK